MKRCNDDTPLRLPPRSVRRARHRTSLASFGSLAFLGLIGVLSGCGGTDATGPALEGEGPAAPLSIPEAAGELPPEASPTASTSSLSGPGDGPEGGAHQGRQGGPARGGCGLPVPVHRSAWIRARDIVFARLDGQDLAYDVFRAPGDTPRPAIVLLHGGGWRAGRRDHVNEPARAFASLGYAAVPVSYRLVHTDPPSGRFPAAVNDVRCAVRHLRANAEAYGVDPERIGVLGFSAGGHLAAMLATASDVDDLEPECPVQGGSAAVQVAVSFYGAHDLNAPFGSGARRLIAAFTGPPGSEAQRTRASPITYVDPSDPPLLLVHGVRDTVVPVSQSRLMYERLLAANVRSELVEVPAGLHGFSVFRPDTRHPAASCATVRFLAEQLHPIAIPPQRLRIPRQGDATPAPAPVAP